MKTKIFDAVYVLTLLASTNLCHVPNSRNWMDHSKITSSFDIFLVREPTTAHHTDKKSCGAVCLHAIQLLFNKEFNSFNQLRLRGGCADNRIEHSEIIVDVDRSRFCSSSKVIHMDIDAENEEAMSDVSLPSSTHRGRSRSRAIEPVVNDMLMPSSTRSDEHLVPTLPSQSENGPTTGTIHNAQLRGALSRASEVSYSRSSSPNDDFDIQQIAFSGPPSPAIGGKDGELPLDRSNHGRHHSIAFTTSVPSREYQVSKQSAFYRRFSSLLPS
jgi:hypothetical protein